MRRVLIVDDESPIISALELLIKRYFPQEYLVVGEARNGREAIEKARELNPDIILIDVQMPGINGLEAIRSISQSGGTKAFVLITAYERFDIAREALRLGVCDYVLKPISRDRLEIALRSASLFLDRLNLIEEKELAFLEREQQVAEYIREAFFNHLMEGHVSPQDLKTFLSVLHLSCNYAAMGILYFLPFVSYSTRELYTQASHTIQYKTTAILGPLVHQRYAPFFIPLSNTNDIQPLEELIKKELAAPIASGEIQMLIGSPGLLTEVSHLWEKVWQEFVQSSQSISLFDEHTDGNKPNELWPWALDHDYYEAVTHHQWTIAQKQFEEIILNFQKYQNMSPVGLYRLVSLLTYGITEAIQEGTIPRERGHALLSLEALFSLYQKGLVHELGAWCRNQFQQLLQEVHAHREYSASVRKILQYLEEHYQEPISLELVADIMNLSPVTVSRMLSEEVGQGFARTLIEIRLKRAKELLQEGNLSIKEISQACGYQDPNYFARLFKNYTGMTPREYGETKREEPHET
ncbi:MAG: response regulator [Treponemataceae bacterium]|nr:response regulator [Treponemataceae bacterium]